MVQHGKRIYGGKFLPQKGYDMKYQRFQWTKVKYVSTINSLLRYEHG